ncbi:helix-turn-helix domain-containing protein [Saccharopolyspora taberi]
MALIRNSAAYDDQVIAAARMVFAEQGFAAPMSEVARRAGVGVASVYRRYPSKQALMEAVRIASFDRIIQLADMALATRNDPFSALATFMRDCLEENTPVGTVLPPLDEGHVYSEEFHRLQNKMAGLVDRLVTEAQDAGAIRKDVNWADILLLFKHLNPNLPISEHRRAEFRARYVSIVIEGLRSDSELPAPGPGEAEWRRMCDNRSGR